MENLPSYISIVFGLTTLLTFGLFHYCPVVRTGSSRKIFKYNMFLNIFIVIDLKLKLSQQIKLLERQGESRSNNLFLNYEY